MIDIKTIDKALRSRNFFHNDVKFLKYMSEFAIKHGLVSEEEYKTISAGFTALGFSPDRALRAFATMLQSRGIDRASKEEMETNSQSTQFFDDILKAQNPNKK